MPEVRITDEFTDLSGEFQNYDAYSNTDRVSIRGLKHRDIRDFQNADTSTATILYYLSTFGVGVLDAQTMTALESHVLDLGEHWSTGTAGPDSSYNYFNVLALTCPIGTTTTSSTWSSIDILNDFESTDSISVALPTFPASSLNLATSQIRFSDGTITASVNFNQSTVALVTGNSELRFPRSLLEPSGINLADIKTVIFSMVATGACTVRFMAIRIFDPAWTAPQVDIDTKSDRLHRTPPLNGDIAAASAFAQPILWRTSDPPGAFDPKPVDAEVAVTFNPGTIVQSNSFTLYFREVSEDFMTQIDLEDFVQAQLDGDAQPDLGAARFLGRRQYDVDPLVQTELETATQFELERAHDPLSASWIQFSCQWYSGGGTISILDTEGNGYSFTIPALSNNQDYAFFAKLEENAVRATIYTLDNLDRIVTKFYDTTIVVDDFAFVRRPGRFGWLADLRDGGASIGGIQARSMNFGEYRSRAIESNTPVVGAELFVSTSPAVEHFETLAAGIFNTTTGSTISRDSGRSTTSESYRVDIQGSEPLQGLQSNIFEISDLDNTEITFDLYASAAAIDQNFGIHAYLQSRRGLLVKLLMPVLFPDQWQQIRILTSANQSILTGEYSFVLVQDSAIKTTWWVDNVSIFSRSVAWEGRAAVEDPWGGGDAAWLPFRNSLNRVGGGIVFPHRGSELQVRGKAVRQDAAISRVRFIPKYAGLGRFVTPASVPAVAPTSSFTQADLGGHTARLTSTSTDADGYVALCYWSFGDGATSVGTVADHTYAAAGVYPATLVAMDNNGNRSSVTNLVAVA